MKFIKRILMFFLITNIVLASTVMADPPIVRKTSKTSFIEFCASEGVSTIDAEKFYSAASGGATETDISKFVEVAYAKNSDFSSFAYGNFYDNLINYMNPGRATSINVVDLKKKVETYRETLKTNNGTADNENWWGTAANFFNSANASKTNLSSMSNITSLIKLIGNAVFIIVTIVLGIKYMYGSAEGKMSVKEGLISLTVAMVFFYGWSALENILYGTNIKLIWIESSSEATIGNVYATIVYFLNFIAVGGLIYVGIKFLLSGAEGKAELKGKGIPFAIGMVLTFSTLTFLNFMTTVIGEIL